MPNVRRSPPGDGGGGYGIVKRQWEEILPVALILAGIGLYLLDAASRSTRVENLILIVPLTVAAIVAGLVIVGTVLFRRSGPDRASPTYPSVEGTADEGRDVYDWRFAGIAVCLLAYAYCLDLLGLDLATALFLSSSLAILGVRGIFGLLVAPVGIAIAVVWGMKTAFYIHIPVFLVGTF